MVYYVENVRNIAYVMEVGKRRDGKIYVCNEERWPLNFQKPLSEVKREIRLAIERNGLKGDQEEIAEIVEKINNLK